MFRKKHFMVTAVIFALVCILGGVAISASDGESPKLTAMEIQEALRTSSLAYGRLVAKHLSVASTEDLQQLKRHENWGIAIHAAWEQWVDDRRQLYGPYSNARVVTGVQRWLGFVEGKLGVSVPEDWSKSVSTAKLKKYPRQFNTDPRFTESFWFDRIESSASPKVELLPGLYGDAGISVSRKEKGLLELTRGERSVQIHLDELVNFGGDDGFNSGDTIEWSTHQKCEFVVFVKQGSNGAFNIVMVPEGSMKPAWVAIAGKGYLYGGVFTRERHATLRFSGETVVVFSYSDCLSCVEGFDLGTGTAIAKFHSAIW